MHFCRYCRSHDNIIYSKYIDGEYSIYEISLDGKTSEKNKIDSNALISYANPDTKTVYYSKDDSLYIKEFGKNKEKITSDFSILVTVADDGSIYYLKEETVVNKLSNYVKDDMADADKVEIVLPEPDYSYEPEYPSRSDYQIEVWVDSWWGYERHPETDEWGYWTTETDEEAYQAAIDEFNLKHAEWEKEVEKYNNEYNAAYRQLLAQEFRNNL